VAKNTEPRSNRLSDVTLAAGNRKPFEAVSEIVAAEDLSVVFQPIIDMGNGTLLAYEALVRCRIPAYSSPPDLFERAVESGSAGELGRLIREIAVPLSAGIPIFLNVHPDELRTGWLVRPDDPIFAHDDAVYLEITESVPFTHFDLCNSVLRELRERGGVHLVVDDLGAGYSNLKYIVDLNPRVVKLDRGLIAGLTQGSRLFTLVHSVIGLCRELGALVVAEGIETEEELQAVIAAGANFGQGYLLARPSMPLPPVNWPGGTVRTERRKKPTTLRPRTTTKNRKK
jgi:EAL domain-containing protein (putative c-di-GMP-specific phosphodiesterase class I)